MPIQPLRQFNIAGGSMNFEKTVGLYKNSRKYLKYKKGTNVLDAELNVYNNGKINYIKYIAGRPAMRIESQDGIRTYFVKKRGKFIKTKELCNGVQNFCEWYMNIFTETGEKAQQIIKYTKKKIAKITP